METRPNTNGSRRGLTAGIRWYWLVLLLAVVALVVVLRAGRESREDQLASQDRPTLKRLASAPDSDPLTHLAYGERLARANQPQAALREFQRASQMLEPGRHDALAEHMWARIGYTLAFMGDDDSARPYLDRARTLNGSNWLAYLGEGLRLVHQHEAGQAIEPCLRAVAARPQSYEAHYLLGLAYNDSKNPGAAESELKRALALAPEFAAAAAELGHAYAFQSRYAEAAESFRAARKLSPESREYLFALGEALGMGARNPEQYREAAGVQEECLRASPGNAALLFALGQLHLRFMNLSEAYRCLRRSSELRPTYAKPWVNLGRVAGLLGDETAARQAYARFHRPRSNTTRDDSAVRFAFR